MLQQRVLSLQTLSKIIQRDQQREYLGLVAESVVGVLVGAQLPLLLRFALDESAESVVKAAVQAIHSLMVVNAEEVGTVCKTLFLCVVYIGIDIVFRTERIFPSIDVL